MFDIYDDLIKIIPAENVAKDVYMTGFTSFKIGGPADYMVSVSNSSELSSLIKYLKENKVAFMILGNGSNILVSDKGYRGVMIRLGGDFRNVVVDGNKVIAGAGVTLMALTREVLNASLSGLEFAYGIPGSVGGAVYMNAGAYGGEMKDVITSVEVLDEEGNVVTIEAKDMDFGYRTSICKRRDIVVLKANMELVPGSHQKIEAKMEEHMKARKDKQPYNMPSAGSTFKRPEGYFAGKLITDSGLSGYQVGQAQVSVKHNGFVVNLSGATASDVAKLIKDVKEKVYSSQGVMLEEEVIYVGEFE